MTGPDAQLIQRAASIRMLILDVDGVLTDGRLYFDSQGNELKAFHVSDGLGIKAVQSCGIAVAIITARQSPMVSARTKQLGIEHVYQGSDDKLSAYLTLLKQSGLQSGETCYVGDDWIDLPVLMRAGLAVTVPAADPAVRERAHWVTERGGGLGAVREVCNLILTAQGHHDRLINEFLDT